MYIMHTLATEGVRKSQSAIDREEIGNANSGTATKFFLIVTTSSNLLTELKNIFFIAQELKYVDENVILWHFFVIKRNALHYETVKICHSQKLKVDC